MSRVQKERAELRRLEKEAAFSTHESTLGSKEEIGREEVNVVTRREADAKFKLMVLGDEDLQPLWLETG